MSTEIINARKDPLESGPPSYRQKVTTYQRTAKTDAQQKLFFDGYIKIGTITGAAKLAGIDPGYHYKWLDTDPDYPAKFKIVHQTASEALVEEARRRAITGVEEPTGWYRGEPGGFVRKYSDSLLQFLIKGAFPEIYKERHEHSGKIEVQSTVTIEQFPVWLKQAIVVISSGVEIDGELEARLQAHFEEKFLECEKLKLIGNGDGGKREEKDYLDVESLVIEETAVMATTTEDTPTRPINKDFRPSPKVGLDLDDI